MARTRRKELMDLLWPPGHDARVKTWTILDGARDEQIYPTVLTSYSHRTCLYAGPLPPALEVVSPYLVEMEFDDRFSWKVLSDGFGKSWGVFLRTDTSFERLRRHLREFLIVKTEKGKRLIFRYYDPRVLRVYLPTCTEGELRTFFGPIQEFLIEGEDGSELLSYRLVGGKLQVSSSPVPA